MSDGYVSFVATALKGVAAVGHGPDNAGGGCADGAGCVRTPACCRSIGCGVRGGWWRGLARSSSSYCLSLRGRYGALCTRYFVRTPRYELPAWDVITFNYGLHDGADTNETCE